MAVKAWQEAENLAANYLTRLGFKGVELETGGADGGVDVRVPDLVVAQVKATSSPVGRPVIQQIFGIGQAEGAHAVVFSLSGFSQEAIDWADEQTVSLFVFRKTIGGFRIKPVNPAAHVLIRWAQREYGVKAARSFSSASQGRSAAPRWFEKTWSDSWAEVRSILIVGAVLCLLVFIVGTCMRVTSGDDSDQSPYPTKTSRCPTEHLEKGRVCSKNPAADGLCESIALMPPEMRPELDTWSAGPGALCPYGYRYIEP